MIVCEGEENKEEEEEEGCEVERIQETEGKKRMDGDRERIQMKGKQRGRDEEGLIQEGLCTRRERGKG